MPRREDRHMERSEKRSSYNRDPKKLRKKSGRSFLYGISAIIVSLIVWPAGMVMLWPRRLRWTAGVKLIASLLTLIMCLCWIGFALTVQTDDYRITYVQDKINGFLARSAEFVVERAGKLADDVTYTAGEVGEYAVDNLPGAAEWTNDTINAGKDKVLGLVGIEPEATSTPTITTEPTAVPTEEPTAKPTEEPSSEPTAEPADENTAEPTEEPTEAPTAEPTEEPTPTPEPVEVASASPAPGRATAEPQKLDLEADPTPAPTVKPAGEAIVYHSTNGKSYHEAPDCVGMRGAKGYTLASSVADGFSTCGNCNPPAAELVNTTETVLWQDELNVFHVSDECFNFYGKFTLVKLSDISGGQACCMCGAAHYAPELELSIVNVTPEPTEEPTEEPTAEPTEEPTAEPTEEPTAEPTEEPTPEPTAEPAAAATLKPAGEAIVYHTSNGVGYHIASRCIGMSNAKPYTLAECVADGFRACGNCQVPDASILQAEEPVMWVDTSNKYHTTDECAAFDGQWMLMTLTDAGEAGCTPCADCGAEAYVYTAPTAEPTAEPTPVPENSELPHKSAGEAIVYHTSNGRSYHAAAKCRTMSGAKPYTLAESIADGYGPCGICTVPDKNIIDYPVVWVDANGIGHMNDECTYFEGRYTLETIYDACGYERSGCPYCSADAYISADR